MPLTIDYQPVLDAADLMRRADKDLQAKMRRQVTKDVYPFLRAQIGRKAGAFGQDEKIVKSARVRSGLNPAVVVGGSRSYSGGAVVDDLVRVYEFGGAPQKYSQHRTRHRTSGKQYTVRRRTAAQIPRRTPTGRFIYPAVAATAPVLVHMWIQTILDAYDESL